MTDLIKLRSRLEVMAEIERLRKVARHAEADPSIALACLERAERLAGDLAQAENGGLS